MLSLTQGNPVAIIQGGDFHNELLSITEQANKCCVKCSSKCNKKPCCHKCCKKDLYSNLGNELKLTEGKFRRLQNFNQRSVDYICGPSGCGKSTQASILAENFMKMFPGKPFYLFSRTDAEDDPALIRLKPIQIRIDKSLIDNPIDITKELTGGCLILFDDCNTISDNKLKKAVEHLMNDIMEVGRKLKIWIVITSHLIIPSDKTFARTVLNEMHTLTVFPQAGSGYQITYVLKNYFSLNKKQIEEIINLPSRWVTISKLFPQYVIHENGCYLLNKGNFSKHISF